jgi:hypothetical protein
MSAVTLIIFPINGRKGHDHLKGLKNLVRKLLLLGSLAVVFGATAIAAGIVIGAPLISGVGALT